MSFQLQGRITYRDAGYTLSVVHVGVAKLDFFIQCLASSQAVLNPEIFLRKLGGLFIGGFSRQSIYKLYSTYMNQGSTGFPFG